MTTPNHDTELEEILLKPAQWQLDDWNKAKAALHTYLYKQTLELIGKDIELRGDIDDELLKYVPDMHERSLEASGVSSGFTNLYTRVTIRSVQIQLRKAATERWGQK